MWWGKKTKLQDENLAPVGELPPGVRVYAIGDVHGRSDLLTQLFEMVKKDTSAFKGVVQVVFLGDLIDRGPDSAGVMGALKDWEAWIGTQKAGSGLRILRGNHEQALLDFMGEPETRPEWLGYGGDMACISYGVKVRTEQAFMRPLGTVAAEVLQEMKQRDHWRFIEATQLKWVCGGYLFVHAGVRPNVPLEAQLPHEFYIIREPFLSMAHGLPYRVVHGHTPTESPALLPYRLGLDTGAYRTGVLSCGVLEEDNLRILQTGVDKK